MALQDGRTSILEIVHGQENGSGSTARVDVALLAPGPGGHYIAAPFSNFGAYRNLAMVMGAGQTVPAHRTKQVAHAGAWKVQNVMFADGAVLKVSGTRKGRNDEAGWNRARPQVTSTIFLLAHHLAPEQQFRMRLTGEPGMVKNFAGITGRFSLLTYDEAKARCQGFSMPGATSMFCLPSRMAEVWTMQELQPGSLDLSPVVAVERTMEDGSTVVVPQARARRLIEEL